MIFFIDFEAQQYTNNIISIGCISETGETFYSLVRPPQKRKSKRRITKFITELTGITTEMTEAAPSIDETFSNFYDYIYSQTSNPVFYVYGDSDITFAQTAYTRSINEKSREILKIFINNCIDYSEKVKEHYCLGAAPKLIYVFNHCYQKNDKQDHNALTDAELLRYIYQKINNQPKEEVEEFIKYKEENLKDKSPYIIISIDKNNNRLQYESLNAAARLVTHSTDKNIVRHAVQDIKKVANSDKRFKELKWIIIKSE